jgi:glutathione peroxidase
MTRLRQGFLAGSWLLVAFVTMGCFSVTAQAYEKKGGNMSVFDFTVKDATGKDYPLSQHRGKVLLIVNVASRCGFTPQYTSLEKLYKKYKDQGFVVLGFPCNQFGAQEPGSNEEIQTFCSNEYGVTFPVLAKIDVNGNNADPLYVHLKSKAPGIMGSEAIKWNFTKFLVDREGKVIQRYAPQTTPEQIDEDIAKALKVNAS